MDCPRREWPESPRIAVDRPPELLCLVVQLSAKGEPKVFEATVADFGGRGAAALKVRNQRDGMQVD